jgi:hypothetical protein
MTVTTQSNFVTYPGDNVAVTFPFTFPVYDADHLYVYLQDTTTDVLALLSAANYSVTGIGNENGGSVVTNVAVASTDNIVIARILPFTQDLSVLNEGGFYPENFEKELDLQEMQLQQLDEEVGRSVRGQLTEAWPVLSPPAERSGKLLGFTGDANAYPTTDTEDLLFTLLSTILIPGSGISISAVGGTITITNSAPNTDQDCWLLESGGPGSGTSGDAEFVRDTIFAALVGNGVTITQDDPGDTITLTVSGSVTLEQVYDAIASSLVSSTGIIEVDSDVGDTTTISVDPEFIRDTVGPMFVGGVGTNVTVSDVDDTITIDSAPKIQTVASAAIVTPTFANDQVNITAQGEGLTLANPTGTVVDGHGILIRIKDNGTSRAIIYGAKYRAFGAAKPTATTINKTLYIGIVYNATDDKWDVLSSREEV